MAENKKVSPAELQKYLKGVDYPAQKEELIDAAQEEDAPEHVLDFIESLPNKEYQGPTDVTKELGKLSE